MRKLPFVKLQSSTNLLRQFGNILVLTAVYNSSIRNYIAKLNKQALTDLFDRTIAILAEMQDNSPTLRLDMLILQALRKQQQL